MSQKTQEEVCDALACFRVKEACIKCHGGGES